MPKPDNKAWGIGLDQDNVVLLDYDGDARINLLCMTPLDSVYYSTDGKTWCEEKPIPSGAEHLREVDFSSKEIRLADLNGDGRTDIVWWIAGKQYYFVKNPKDGWTRIEHPAGHGGIPNQPIQNFRLVDIDGDGITDLMLYNATHQCYWPGLGGGNWDRRTTLWLPRLATHEYERADFVDLTGDGLAELVVPHSDSISYWVGLGEGNFSQPEGIIHCPKGMPTNPALYRWTDMNGDGVRDLLYYGHKNKGYVYLAFTESPKANLIQRIDNGIGGVVQIAYQSAVFFNTGGNTPFPMWLVEELQSADGINPIQKTRFAYQESFYDTREREFKGFREIQECFVGQPNAPTLVSHKYYHSGFGVERALWGRLEKVQLFNTQGELLSEDKYQWQYIVKTKQVLLTQQEHLGPVHQ